jgi:hypothetical protein
LHEADGRIAGGIHGDFGLLIEFGGPFFEFLGDFFVESGKDGSLAVAVNEGKLFIDFDTK